MEMRASVRAIPAGELLRRWRDRRHRSQMALALQAEVSPRHLSFVETGRAQPGRELILRLAEELEIPLRERNRILMSAGCAPVFQVRRFEDPEFDPIRGILDLTLERHKPFPAYVIDRYWNIVRSNSAVPELYEGIDADLLQRPVNVVRLVLHPKGMAPRIRNLGAWRTHLATQLRHQIEVTGDPALEDLLRELLGYPSGQDASHEWQGGPAMPMIVETRLGLLSFIGATTVFGTPADVTLEEIALEVMHPADAFTDEAVRASSVVHTVRAIP